MNTKHKYFLFISLLLLWSSINLYAQKTSFEGEIIYVAEYVSKQKLISNKSLKSYFGDTIISYIKNGSYYQQYLNSNGPVYMFHQAGDQYLYLKNKLNKKLTRMDCTISDCAELLGTQKKNDVTHILGYACNSISIKTSCNQNTFYYAEDLYSDPSNYSNHVLNFMNVYTKETSSEFLKLVSENDRYITTITAVKVERKPVDDTLFKLKPTDKVNSK